MNEHEDNHETIRQVLNERLSVDVGTLDGTGTGHADVHNQIHKVVNALMGGERIWWCSVHQSTGTATEHGMFPCHRYVMDNPTGEHPDCQFDMRWLVKP